MFPEDFLWGVSESGFQFEMGDPEGKNIDPNTDWFKWVHDLKNINKKIVSGDLPENGVDYWDLYETDHDLAKRMGMNAYRLGVEWSRVFPRSTRDIKVGVEIASDGRIKRVELDDKDLEKLESFSNINALKHYEEIIEDLIRKDFNIIVCLNHFTLPIWIHDPIIVRDSNLKKGPRGWYDQDTVVEFVKYAAFMAWKLGDKIDMWATFNEPTVVAEMGYFMIESGFPPGVRQVTKVFKNYKRVLLNMIDAHSRAYEAIKKFDTEKANSNNPSSIIGVIQNIIPVIPYDSYRDSDIQASGFLSKIHNTLFLDAITSGWIDLNFNGFKDSDEVKSDLSDKLDWLGLNYYTRMVVAGGKSILAKFFMDIPIVPTVIKGYGFACEPGSVSSDNRPTSDFGWELYPDGLAQALIEVSKYGKPIYVTENGIADSKDNLRGRYIFDHLRILENLVDEKRVDVRGYFHWALTDNYEWAKGFHMKFGLYSVDLESKKRFPRNSTEVLRKIIENGTVKT
ncbi:MAG: beta-galactosidase BgaS [Nitrososphaerota archaeon]|nr:beta-galactosidase BgaS [Nitrososphaerota archaeon]